MVRPCFALGLFLWAFCGLLQASGRQGRQAASHENGRQGKQGNKGTAGRQGGRVSGISARARQASDRGQALTGRQGQSLPD